MRVILMDERLGQVESRLASLEARTNSRVEQALVATVRRELERQSRSTRSEVNTAVMKNSAFEAMLSQVQQQVSGLTDENQRLRFKLEELSMEISFKAYTDDLYQIRDSLEAYCPLRQFEALSQAVASMAKAEQVTSLNHKYKANKAKMYATFLSKEEAKTYFSGLKHELEQLISQCCTKEELKVLNQNLLKRMSYLTQEITEAKRRTAAAINSFENQLGHLRDVELQQKVDIDEFREVELSLERTLTLEAFEQFQKEAQIKLLHSTVDSLLSASSAQEQALLRHDELLLEKSSKIDFHSLRDKLDKIWKHVGLEDQIDQLWNS